MDNFVPPLPRQPRQWWSRFRLAGIMVLALLAYGALYLLDTPSEGLNTLSAWVRWLIAVFVTVGLYEIIEGGLDENVLWNREMPVSEARHACWRRMLGTTLGLGLLGLLAIWLAGKLL